MSCLSCDDALCSLFMSTRRIPAASVSSVLISSYILPSQPVLVWFIHIPCPFIFLFVCLDPLGFGLLLCP